VTDEERATDIVLSLPTRMVTHNEDLRDILAEALAQVRAETVERCAKVLVELANEHRDAATECEPDSDDELSEEVIAAGLRSAAERIRSLPPATEESK